MVASIFCTHKTPSLPEAEVDIETVDIAPFDEIGQETKETSVETVSSTSIDQVNIPVPLSDTLVDTTKA